MKISIKRKVTIFIIVMLVVNIMIIGYFMLSGIKRNQRSQYENELKQKSKIVNTYIRESFARNKSYDLEKYYIENAKTIDLGLDKILNLKIDLYDMEGKYIGYKDREMKEYEKTSDLMSIVLENNIVYKVEGNIITYAAPIYDYNKQIGVLKLDYSIKRYNDFYKEIQILFIKIALISMVVMFIVARLYLLKIIKNIFNLKKSVKQVEEGKYDNVEVLLTNDEFGELSHGIRSMSLKIKDNINQLTIEKEKLKKALIRLQKLEKKQKEFIGNITHEFRTPITVVKTQIDLISMYGDDEEMVEKAQDVAKKELVRLNDMVEKILYLASMDQYEFELYKVEINTKDMMNELLDRMKMKALKYGIKIHRDLTDAIIFMDHDSFVKVFINIIDNAIKYNKHEGHIYIRSKIENGKNIIDVEDTGLGIPDEYKSRIFEPFFTIDKNRSKQFSGTGLGLGLVKKLLNGQQSSIEVLSGKKGTIFRITIPLANKN